jgi:hypothetical protein
MILFKKDKIFEGAKLRCKASYDYTTFEVGKEYVISSIFLRDNDNIFDIYINRQWFKLLVEDNKEKEVKTIFPLAHLYFFTEQEERKIKLQILDLQSKIKNNEKYIS